MDFFLGVDGGGTKTDFLACPRGLADPVRVQAAGTSRSRATPESVAAQLERGCHAVCDALGASASGCVSVCAGFASASLHADFYQRTLRALLPRARVRVMTDAALALEAATAGGDGIVVISGTGSIACGRYAGRSARAGGAGPGRDPGSGDWIGREAVRAGLAAAPSGDQFAALVPSLAAQGSPRTDDLFRRAGVELAALLLACARDLRWSSPAAFFAGGVLTHIPQVHASLAAAWPHSLAALPRSPAAAALDLAVLSLPPSPSPPC